MALSSQKNVFFWIRYSKVRNSDEMMADLKTVTKDQVEEIAREFFTRPLTLGLAGPVKNLPTVDALEKLVK